MSKSRQIIKARSEAPWAILPEKLAVIRELIAFRAEGHRLTDEEIQARIGVAPQRQAAGTQGAGAILPLFGVVVERPGVKTTRVRAGRFKTERSPFEPLSDEARAALQARVDTVYEMFVNDVAAGRRVTPDAVRGGFGEGRLVTASDALREGMVDG